MKTIILCGKSGSGKTTVGLELEKLGYKKIVVYTTRPRREGEVNGVDYHFVSENDFQKICDKGEFAETAEYDASFGYCRYGSLKADYQGEDKYIILNPIGLKKVLDSGMKAFVVYLYADDDVLVDRLRKRNDDPAEIARRLTTDEADFKGILSYVDITVGTSFTPEFIAKTIVDFERRKK